MLEPVAVYAPPNVGGSAIARAASGLALLPSNASRLVRLHRLAALGMALADDSLKPLSSSAVRALLKRDDIGGSGILRMEDPYSEIVIQSISFYGGEYLVSPGSGEHTVSDVEHLADAAFREDWMPKDLHGHVRQLIQGLLVVSNLVLRRAGMTRGTRPGRDPRTPMDVPSAARLDALAQAAFLSHDDLQAHGPWLQVVVDTFSLDPGQLTDPCSGDFMEERFIETPFLRLADGYQIVVPLDLLLTVRHHLLRFIYQEGQLEELGKRYRAAALRRVERQLQPGEHRQSLSQEMSMHRYLFSIDSATDLHVVVATDHLVDWSPDHAWGMYDTREALARIEHLIQPDVRSTYSTAESLLHLVITDSPGRSAFWGVPNVDGADPVLMARAEDLEVMLHREADGALGLMYFAEALDRRRGGSITTNILDEYSAYEENGKSFYFSDDSGPTFTVFEVGDGYFEREKFFEETERHGVEAPVEGRPMVQVTRRYNRDAPEIFIVDPSPSFTGYVVEVGANEVFVSPDRSDGPLPDVTAALLESVAFWVRECIVIGRLRPRSPRSHIMVSPGPASIWSRLCDDTTSRRSVALETAAGTITLRFTDLFVAQLHDESNVAERELVEVLLSGLFAIEADEVVAMLNLVAPLGPKRMLNAFSENKAPDMRAERLPPPLTGHDQVTEQILDELGDWLRDPQGVGIPVGPLTGPDRSDVLKKAVAYLFQRLETQIAQYDQGALLEYLIAQNEALVHSAKYNEQMLRSRLACFGVNAETTKELVKHRSDSASASRANRFLIEYVAAQPPQGDRLPTTRRYCQLLELAKEIIERGTASDFLHFDLADFEVSILESGRLGMNRDEPVDAAMKAYVAASGARTIQSTTDPLPEDTSTPTQDVVSESADAMRSEYGFTLSDLREVCGGLLDIGMADQVTRVIRADASSQIAEARNIHPDLVNTVLNAITLSPRDKFMSIGSDAFPWRFNRDMSYVRRPLVLQGDELVFGFRSILGTGPYWLSGIMSGRLQANARTQSMKAYISHARGRINREYAVDVADRLRGLGLTAELAVNRVGGRRITDPDRLDLGDIDVLAWHPTTRTILAVEAKDFEVARTPAEMSHEIVKLFLGKQGKKIERSTVDKHARRIDWIRANLADVLAHMGADARPADCSVIGVIVTSEPLVTPLVTSSTIPVIAFPDLGLDTLGLAQVPASGARRRRR